MISEESALSIKVKLYAECVAYVQRRIDTAEKAMNAAQESANDETKSSAGDKHETGRAMAQLEREKSAIQLAEATNLKRALSQFKGDIVYNSIRLGSLVYTGSITFYIALSVGKIELDGEVYFAISPGSPMGQHLSKMKLGDESAFNGRPIRVEAVY